MCIVERTEQHVIKKSNKYYSMLKDYCIKSKNLYNHANFLVRRNYMSNKTWLRYSSLDIILKADIEYFDYRNMPTAQSAQQTLRMLDEDWKQFFRLKKSTKFIKFPKYKKKNHGFIVTLTNQNCKIKDDTLCFPKTFKKFTLNVQCIFKQNFRNIRQVRIIPKKFNIIVEVVYHIEIPDSKKDNGRYLSIDIGVDNLAAVTNNFGKRPILINGKGLKSINQYYNKKTAYYQSTARKINNSYSTNRILKLANKRNAKIKDYIHKVSRYVVNYAQSNDVCVVVIGYNKQWKSNLTLGHINNQKFHYIPFSTLIHQMIYKAEECGIQIILAEESYTSGTSFLDNEPPTKDFYDKSRRIYRGLFKTNSEKLINADVNGSLQIMKKVFPNAFANGIEGVALHPIRVTV